MVDWVAKRKRELARPFRKIAEHKIPIFWARIDDDAVVGMKP